MGLRRMASLPWGLRKHPAAAIRTGKRLSSRRRERRCGFLDQLLLHAAMLHDTLGNHMVHFVWTHYRRTVAPCSPDQAQNRCESHISLGCALAQLSGNCSHKL